MNKKREVLRRFFQVEYNRLDWKTPEALFLPA